MRPMSWYVRMTGLFPLGVPRMVTWTTPKAVSMSCSCRERRRSLGVTCAACATGNPNGRPAARASSARQHHSPTHSWWLSTALAICNNGKTLSPTTAKSRLLFYRCVKVLGLCLPVTKISFQWPLVTLLCRSRSQVS